MANEKRFNVKAVALLLTLMLTVGGVIGGTIAWLIASPDPVVNTFTYGDINIELEETDTQLDNDNDDTTNQYKMMPGQEIKKDPTITVKKGSEDMWLFVKLEKSSNFDTFMEYEIADGWTALDETNHPGVYYQSVNASTVASNDEEYTVIKDNTVTVNEAVTKDDLNALDSGTTANYPTLTVTAYAVQRDTNISTAAIAWEKVTGNQTTTP